MDRCGSERVGSCGHLHGQVIPLCDRITSRRGDLGNLTGVSASLVQQTVDTSVTPRTIPTPQPVNWVNKNGWYVSIPLGERVTIEPRLQLGTVSFVANNPVDDYCALGGSSWLYALDYKTGGAITPQADNVVGISVDTKTIGTGLTIVRLPNGLLIAIVSAVRKSTRGRSGGSG